MKKQIKIERENVSVPGHNGFGRYVLIGKEKSFRRLTEKQASETLGRSILQLCDYYLKNKRGKIWELDNVGIKLTIELEDYDKEK